MSEENRTVDEDQGTSMREQAPPSVTRDMGITVAFSVFAAVFLVISDQFAGNRISETDPGAAFWPRVTLIVLLVAGLLNLGLLYQRAKENNETIAVSEFGFSNVTDLSEKQRQYVMAVALSIIFIFSLEYIGFLVATPFFLFAFAYSIGYRDIGNLAVFSILVDLIVFFAFRNIMNIALPYGISIFREISINAANLF